MELNNMRNITDDELDKLIQDADVEKLEYVVLSGRGGDLRGRSSWNEQLRRFLKRVPGQMVSDKKGSSSLLEIIYKL